jgi:O-antigen ligase
MDAITPIQPQGTVRNYAAEKTCEPTVELDLKNEPPTSWKIPSPTRRATLAYFALVFFSCVYFFRPEDFVPGLSAIPLAKITGGITLLALVFGVKAKDRGRLQFECKILIALLLHMILTIPFAAWRGGSYDTVVNKFSKGVIVALLIALVIIKVDELRRLLYIQAAAVALVTVGSLIARHTVDGRLMGIQKGILENPNDLAINIAINFPLCMAFMFAAKGGLRRVVWAFGLICMMYAVVATYSRSGMIAMIITCLICLWEFGVKGRRVALLIVGVMIGVISLGVILVTPKYLGRMESLFHDVHPEFNTVEARAQGSVEARTQLLKEAIRLTLEHPIFGVGPGNFPVVTQEWRVTHNTYAELGAEAGFPGLLLFVAMLFASFGKLRRLKSLSGYATDEDIQLWTSALRAAMVAYLAGAMFASTEYNLFPYFMVGYICALYYIASKPVAAVDALGNTPQNGDSKQLGRTAYKEREFA